MKFSGILEKSRLTREIEAHDKLMSNRPNNKTPIKSILLIKQDNLYPFNRFHSFHVLRAFDPFQYI